MLAGLASYIDAGSIVAGAAGLALWAEHFSLTSGMVGAIGAFSSNAISAGVGALISGWLCDRHGRKRIYQWDLLLYAFGLLWIIFAVSPWMLILGYVLTGLAVGADIPASWTLISEQAPEGRRARHTGMAQVLWGLGPLVVLIMAFALSSTGLLGIRIVFAHLLVVSLVLFWLRRRLPESRRWEHATEHVPVTFSDVRGLLNRSLLAPLLLLAGTYGIWNLYAGTNGFFFPYILRTVGAQTQAQALGLQALGFVLGICGAVFVFMRFADRGNQRGLFGAGVALQICAVLLIAIFPLGAADRDGLRRAGRAGRGVRPAGVLHALERRVVPDLAARHGPGPDVRRRAHRPRRVELLRPDADQVGVPHAGLDPAVVPGDLGRARHALRALAPGPPAADT